jgi:nucleotide-binding universal stress UspA family protein
MRGLAVEAATRRKQRAAVAAASVPMPTPVRESELSGPPILCAVRGIGRTLDFALDDAKSLSRPLYLLFIREQPIVTTEDRRRKWQDDPEARTIFEYAFAKAAGHPMLPCYAVSDATDATIVDIAATIGANRLILGAPRRGALVRLLRGNLIRHVSEELPEDIGLVVYV